jgi:ribonuclease VapC
LPIAAKRLAARRSKGLGKIAVLDSSAILAVIFNEPGSDTVVSLLKGALLSTVNLVEVHTRLLLQGAPADLAWRRLVSMGCEVCLFDPEQARTASEMIWNTRPHGLSLGDRACLALAIQRQAIAYTTDRSWTKLSLGIEIKAIR